MKTTGNTILITGGGTGIGRGLAQAFHALGNQVIISGRTQKSLDATTVENPGMKSLTVDMADAASIRSFAAKLARDFPSLNVLINNAGMMRPENLLSPAVDSDEAEAHVVTNLLGPIRLTAALLPLLQKQTRSTVMLVSSVLGVCALGRCAHVLRYQGRHPRVCTVVALPTQGDARRSARAHPSLRCHHIAG